jgi:hypothetical protein
MAARNRTIDNAPTNPNDSARDDFTTVMINMVVVASTMKFLANDFLLERLLPYFTYTQLRTHASNAHVNSAKRKLSISQGPKFTE